MTLWVNKSVSVNNTGTNVTNVQYNFTAATAGNLLVAVATGPVTWTTPTGWFKWFDTVSGSGQYVFYRNATGGETSFTSTHNGTGGAAYPNQATIFEFYQGSSMTGTPNGGTVLGWTNTPFPSVTNLSGSTNLCFGQLSQGGAGTGDPTLTVSGNAIVDSIWALDGTGDDNRGGLVYEENWASSSWSRNYTYTSPSAVNPDGLTFAVNVVTRPTSIKRGMGIVRVN